MRGAVDPTGDFDDLDLDPPGVIKYMGSKRSLVPVIAPSLASIAEPGTTVLDLFAGTHSVGYSMRRRNRVVGVDAQRYSRVIGNALLGEGSVPTSAAQVLGQLQPHLERHRSALATLYEAPLATERRLLRELSATEPASDAVDAYATFQAGLPDPAAWARRPARAARFETRLRNLVEERRETPDAFPYVLMTVYYANAYFGVAQAIALDGLRYGIDQTYGDGRMRDLCLTALLSAASNCTSTPGHFAMWRVVRTAAGARDIVRYRTRDPLTYFSEKLQELMDRACDGPPLHQTITGEACEFVRMAQEPVGVAYADPPYSPVHYSRFYHVLEELVDYDYPPVFFGGRFPADRYSSPWSVRSQAPDAFRELLETLAEHRWPTVISYGSTGVVSEATLIRLCQAAFGNSGVSLRTVATRHASMGRADRGARPTRELLITCRPRNGRRSTAGSGC